MLNLEPLELPVIQIGVAQPVHWDTLVCRKHHWVLQCPGFPPLLFRCPFCELENMYMETVSGRRRVAL